VSNDIQIVKNEEYLKLVFENIAFY